MFVDIPWIWYFKRLKTPYNELSCVELNIYIFGLKYFIIVHHFNCYWCVSIIFNRHVPGLIVKRFNRHMYVW